MQEKKIECVRRKISRTDSHDYSFDRQARVKPVPVSFRGITLRNTFASGLRSHTRRQTGDDTYL